MVNRKKRILFISHDSTLTGAPILLLNLLRLLKETSIFDFEVLLYRGGNLEKEFKKLAAVDVLKNKGYALETGWFKKIKNYISYRLKLVRWKNRIEDFDLVFSNTITNGRLLQKILAKNIPVVSYVHELQSVIEQFKKDAELTLLNSNVIAVPSNTVKENLVKNHVCSPGQIKILNYYFPFIDNSDIIRSKMSVRKAFLDKFDIPSNMFYVVSMGTATYRKGFDLFVKVAQELKSYPDIYMIWIGDFIKDESSTINRDLIDKNVVGKNLLITGFLDHSITNLLPFDLFLLTSREDPYPLVAIEAAFNRIPIIGFESGGVEEFVGDNCGWIIPEFSTSLMAEKIIELKKEQAHIQQRGENAFQKAIMMHANENSIISQIKDIFLKAGL